MNSSANKVVVIFCPNPSSLYTTSLCEKLLRAGVTVHSIVVRRFTLRRFFNEFARDGHRLIKKIWKKLVLRDKAYSTTGDNIASFRKNNDIQISNIKEFASQGVKIIKCNSLNDKNVESHLASIENKIIAFTGGGIIRKNILKESGDGIINAHMGILPKYRGMDLPEWALLEKAPEQVGITFHFMDAGIDTGDILEKIYVPICKGDDIKSLRDRFDPLMVEGMAKLVIQAVNGQLVGEKQPKTENRQYFIVHPRLYQLVNSGIQNIS